MFNVHHQCPSPQFEECWILTVSPSLIIQQPKVIYPYAILALIQRGNMCRAGPFKMASGCGNSKAARTACHPTMIMKHDHNRQKNQKSATVCQQQKNIKKVNTAAGSHHDQWQSRGGLRRLFNWRYWVCFNQRFHNGHLSIEQFSCTNWRCIVLHFDWLEAVAQCCAQQFGVVSWFPLQMTQKHGLQA